MFEVSGFMPLQKSASMTGKCWQKIYEIEWVSR